jgi:hypothetical protein
MEYMQGGGGSSNLGHCLGWDRWQCIITRGRAGVFWGTGETLPPGAQLVVKRWLAPLLSQLSPPPVNPSLNAYFVLNGKSFFDHCLTRSYAYMCVNKAKIRRNVNMFRNDLFCGHTTFIYSEKPVCFTRTKQLKTLNLMFYEISHERSIKLTPPICQNMTQNMSISA